MEEKNEAISLLSTLIANGKEKITDIAQALGFGDKMRNAQDEANAKTVEVLNAKLGDKPLERLDVILAENKVNVEATVENAIAELAGPKMLNNPDPKNPEKIPNAAHAYAAKTCAGLSGEALKNAIEALKKDPAMIALNGLRADPESPMNKAIKGGAATVKNDVGDGIVTHRIGGK